MRTLALNTFSFAFASATRSRSVFSPTTGYNAVRTTSSGLSTAASASLKSIPSLPRTLFSSAVSCRSTRRSARVLIFCTRAISRSTSASVISDCREQHNTASSVICTCSAVSRESEGYILIARDRHAATSLSEQSVEQPCWQAELAYVVQLVDLCQQRVQPDRTGIALERGQQRGAGLVALRHQRQQPGHPDLAEPLNSPSAERLLPPAPGRHQDPLDPRPARRFDLPRPALHQKSLALALLHQLNRAHLRGPPRRQKLLVIQRRRPKPQRLPDLLAVVLGGPPNE